MLWRVVNTCAGMPTSSGFAPSSTRTATRWFLRVIRPEWHAAQAFGQRRSTTESCPSGRMNALHRRCFASTEIDRGQHLPSLEWGCYLLRTRARRSRASLRRRTRETTYARHARRGCGDRDGGVRCRVRAARRSPHPLTTRPQRAQRLDNRPGPLTERQNERRKAAQELILSGQASPDEDGWCSSPSDKYYQAAVTGTGRVFTILSEFGDQGSGKLGHGARPAAQRDPRARPRDVDNSTPLGRRTSTPPYYEDLFFGAGESFADFYTKQSSGNYTVDGEVSDWVQVPGNASTYGDNRVEDFGGSWQFIEDTGNAWYAAAGRGTAVRGRHQGRARHVRRVGPLRLRQRRQLRRARRLHRPLPGGARR